MKKIAVFCVLACLILTGCDFAQAKAQEPKPDKIEIEYFYDQPCATCDDVGEFLDLVKDKLADVKDQYPYDVLAYNTFHDTDKAIFQKELNRLDIGEDVLKSFTGPVMIINGKAYLGTEEIERNLREAYLTAGEDLFVNGRGVFDPSEEKTLSQLLESYPIEDNSAVCVYFYRIGCPECVDLNNDFMDTLPEKVTVGKEEYDLQVIRINTRSGRNNEVISEFFDEYNVDEDNQMVPIVFTRDGFLAGYDAITEGLMGQLENGEGLDFKYPVNTLKGSLN